MKKPVKAALVSALIFPGAGHFLLSSYARGAILLLPFLFAVGHIIKTAVERANLITDKILNGQIPLDPMAISAAITATTANSETLMFKIALFSLFGCWAISIIDSYRIGRQQELNDRKANLSK